MTNDECGMTKEVRMTNDEVRDRAALFGLRAFSFIRPSSFVIRHFLPPPPSASARRDAQFFQQCHRQISRIISNMNRPTP